MKRIRVPVSVERKSRLVVATVAASLLVVALLTASGSATAQSTEEINETFGDRTDESAVSVVKTPSGFAVVGSSYSSIPDNRNALLVRTDRNGKQKALRVFDKSDVDGVHSAIAPSAGGFVLVGSRGSARSGKERAWIAKTALNGDVEFRRTLGGGRAEDPNSVVETPDGGYVVAGSTRSVAAGGGAWIGKVGEDRRVAFTNAYRGASGEEAFEDVEVWKGALAAAGWTAPPDTSDKGSDAWLVGTDRRGVERLDRRFGGNRTDRAFSVVATSDRGLALAGRTVSFGGNSSDAWLIKTDIEGDEVFNRTYGGSGFDRAVSVAQAPDGGYVLVGSTLSFGSGGSDAWLIKTDEDGHEEFNTTFGGPERDVANSVIRTSDGDFGLAGTTESFGSGGKDAWLLKVSVSVPEDTGGEDVSVGGGRDVDGSRGADTDTGATGPTGDEGEDDGEQTEEKGSSSPDGADGEDEADGGDEAEDVSMPGFTVLAALVALLAAALRRRG